MGNPDNEVGRSSDEIQHEVKVDNFYMAQFNVTKKLFNVFTNKSAKNSDIDKHTIINILKDKEQKGKEHPVVNITWNDAIAFCKWLSNRLDVTFRLPTEAEWEYACRAGSITPFNTGENLTTEQANYNGNYHKGQYICSTTQVGKYPPNAWGLYNMHGNVWEWCTDWYESNYYNKCKKKGIVDNPKGPEKGSYRVLRGGSWNYFAQYCRSAYRRSATPGYRSYNIGFRLVFVP